MKRAVSLFLFLAMLFSIAGSKVSAVAETIWNKVAYVSQMIVRDDGKRMIKRISDMSFAR